MKTNIILEWLQNVAQLFLLYLFRHFRTITGNPRVEQPTIMYITLNQCYKVLVKTRPLDETDQLNHLKMAGF